MGISHSFNQPWYTGSAVDSFIPYRLPIALGGHSYLIDPKEYRRRTSPALRDARDSSDEPGEQSLSTLGLWRRSASDWTLGAGQEFFDDLPVLGAGERRRFFESKGIDPWNQHRLKLLHTTSEVKDSANTNLKLLAIGDYLYVSDGTELYWSTDPSVGWTAAAIQASDTPSTSVSDITTDGTSVYAALGANGVHKTALGASTSSAFSAYAATLVEYVNGRLIGAKDNELVEFDSAGVTTTLKTHSNTAFDWTVLAASPSALYASGVANGMSETYYLTVDPDTTTLTAPIWAVSMPGGETLQALAHYVGVMLVGTSRGVRVGAISEDNTLQLGPVIEIDGGITCFEAQGENVWFSWTNFDVGSTGLGRLQLDEFTVREVPAYASDLMASSQGTVLSAATFNGKRYFSVSADGVYAETDDYVTSGTMNTGWIRFGVSEPKIATSVDLSHEPLVGSIDVSIYVDDSTERVLGSSATAGATSPGDPLSTGQVRGELFKLVFTLNRGAASETPVIRRWTLKAVAAPRKVEEILLPIMLHSKVNSMAGAGSVIAVDTVEEYAYLKRLENGGQVITYQEGAESLSVYIDGMELQPYKWRDDRAFYEGMLFVRLITVEAR